MTDKSNWTCGDCGTEYSYKVQFCKNKELDRKMLDKWHEGYQTCKQEMHKELGNQAQELADAIRTLSKYGFVAVPVSGLGTSDEVS